VRYVGVHVIFHYCKAICLDLIKYKAPGTYSQTGRDNHEHFRSKICNRLDNHLLERANGWRQAYRQTQDAATELTLYARNSFRDLVPALKVEHAFLKAVYSSPLKQVDQVFADLPDGRTGNNLQYNLADAGLGAFSVFSTQSASFLAHRRTLKLNKRRCNAEHLFGFIGIVGLASTLFLTIIRFVIRNRREKSKAE